MYNSLSGPAAQEFFEISGLLLVDPGHPIQFLKKQHVKFSRSGDISLPPPLRRSSGLPWRIRKSPIARGGLPAICLVWQRIASRLKSIPITWHPNI